VVRSTTFVAVKQSDVSSLQLIWVPVADILINDGSYRSTSK
jgi:hypothetical protein